MFILAVKLPHSKITSQVNVYSIENVCNSRYVYNVGLKLGNCIPVGINGAEKISLTVCSCHVKLQQQRQHLLSIQHTQHGIMLPVR